ncbi:MAG: hypothetical protein WBM41_18890 [Arenicellales bacterium]
MSTQQADNITMSEGGLYSLATKGAKDVIDIATPRVLDALGAINFSADPGGFMMADMGCADGGTSLEMIRSVLSKLQQLAPGLDATVVYADQPANDFNALVNIVHGRTAFDSWIEEFENAWPLFSGSSFYLQAVPDNTLDLVFSATAMHWLSKKPCNITDHVHMVGASGEDLERFTTQAREDWETILMCRARELKSGSRMVLVNFCRDDSGRYLGNTGGINMFDTFNEIWREFIELGRVTIEEYHNMTLPQYYHNIEEFCAPLNDPKSNCYQAGLRLDNIETRVVPCPFAQQFKADGDVTAFADGLIPTVRSWNQSIFAAGLDMDRPQSERNQIIEDYYTSYHQRVLQDPEGHGMDYVHAYMTISKN